MKRRIQIMLLSLVLFVYPILLIAADSDQSISQLKEEYDKIQMIQAKNANLTLSSKIELSEIRQNIINLKTQLHTTSNINNPIFFRNDVELDNNLTLVDFYMYEYADSYYQAFARLKNKQNKYLEWVKIRFNMYKNGVFKGTDYTYIDFESYGSTGISPYNTSFINTFIDKVDFDSIDFQVEYDIENGEDDILWDQVLQLESVVITPSGSYNKWQGIVSNNHNYSMTFPAIFACILKDNRMVALDYTYLDVQDNEMPPNSSGTFDSYIDLPESYDEIKYYINYALYSMEGSGNLPPNTPIFTRENYSGKTRINTIFNAFVIDPDNDRIDLSFDFGNGHTSAWNGNFQSGRVVNEQYAYPDSGTFSVVSKARDDNLETKWSESVEALITLSSVPQIITSELDDGIYKKYYNFQLESSGGIQPISWQIQSGSLPNGLSLNSNTGLLAGTPTNSGQFSFLVYCTDAGTPSAFDSSSFQLDITNQKPVITSADSIKTFVKSAISYEATATDPDNNSVSFEYQNYPTWLTVSNTTISGIAPNQILDTSFNLIATDGDLSDTTQVFISIRTKPLSILTKNLSEAIYKHAYYDSLSATGGLTPLTWSLIGGQLPEDLKISNSGVISGQPEQSCTFKFTIQVQDSDNPPQTDSLLYELNVINNPPKITSTDTVTTKKYQEFRYVASAVDLEENKIAFTFSNYPSWLSSSDSLLFGQVPLAATDTSFTLLASDGELVDTLKVSILIRTIPLFIDPQELNDAVYKHPYSDTLKASGGISPYYWSIVDEALPAGLNLDSLGIISGIPISSGLFQFTAQVFDSDKPFQMDSLSFQIKVKNSPPQIISNDTTSAVRSKDFVYVASAVDPEGNKLSYKFAHYPSWLLVTDSLLIGNTPLTASDTSFILIASDGEMSDSLKVNISIKEPASVETINLPTHFEMSGNYPNPFNSSTNIKIDIPQANEVALFVYDINGRIVETIHSGKLNAGSHIFSWNASNVSSGLYFISLKTGKFNKVIKCTLLK